MSSSGGRPPRGVQRRDIQAAIAEVAELRALHAALVHGSSNHAHQCLPPPPSQSAGSPSTAVSFPPPFSAEDYPVFTPSREDAPRFNYVGPDTRSLSENWRGVVELQRGGDGDDDEDDTGASDRDNASLRSGACDGFPPNLKASTAADAMVESCRLGSAGREPGSDQKSLVSISRRVMSLVPHSSLTTESKQRGAVLSWLFPRSRRKPKPEADDVSQILKEWGMLSLDSLRKQLLEASSGKDAALREVADMKLSLRDLTRKLTSLESYCEELKKALKQATTAQAPPAALSWRSKAGPGDEGMPVSGEAMVEGFLQIASEARLSVKQFCKTLIQRSEEDSELSEKLTLLLRPHQLALGGGTRQCSKAVLYHLEAAINETLYEDFENCGFQRRGPPKHLDPQRDRQEKFSAFVALRNLSWNEVLRKGTKYYSEEFSQFCDRKMGTVVSALGWTRPWPEPLLQCFFVAAKCAWLLHLLAFSFEPALGIFRVEEERAFDPAYMEDMLLERQQGPRSTATGGKVKVMVMPGFYVRDGVLKCRVLCRYRSGR